MARKILCVAEKPAIAKSVAQHLSGGQVTTVGGFLVIYILKYFLAHESEAKHHRQSICKELRFRFQLWSTMGQLPRDHDKRHRASH